MKQNLANFSTDLLRISYWIIDGRMELANKFLKLCEEKYSSLPSRVGNYDDIWKEVKKIQKQEGGQRKAAERASTLSVILLNQV